MAWFGTNTNEGYPDHGLRPLIVDKRSIVGYSEGHVTKTEQIVEVRRISGWAMMDHKDSPGIMELYKDHGLRDDPFLAFWSSARDRPDKDYDYSPKVRDGVYRDNNPLSRDHYYGKYNNPYNNVDKYEDEDEDEDDDIVCKDGVCVKNNKGGAIKSNYLKEEDHDNEKHKGKGYPPSSYTIPPSSQPRKDTHYESSYPNNDEKHKGNDYHAPQPRKHSYYETSNNRPIVANPPPIKTRSDHIGRGNESPKNSPDSIAGLRQKFNASPRKDESYQEIIDSAEARRHYARASPPAEEKYTGTISSKEAARKYNGVFVPF